MTIYTWIATIIALTGTVTNCKKMKICFVFWIITNIMWLIWDLKNGTISRGVLDIVQGALAVYGLWEWSRDRNG